MSSAFFLEDDATTDATTAESEGGFSLEPSADELVPTEQVAVPAPVRREGETIKGGEVSGEPFNYKRLALEAGLGIVAAGATRGATFPGTVARLGPPAARLLARSLAAGTGEAIGSLKAESFDPTESPLETAAIAGGAGFVGERFIGPAINRIVKGGTNLVGQGKEFIEEAIEGGVVPSIGRATTNRAIDITEGVSAKSVWGGGILSRQVVKTQQFFDNVAKEFVATFGRGSSKEAVEDLARVTLEGEGDAFRASGKMIFKDLDRVIADSGSPARVDITSLLERATQIADEGLDPAAGQKILRLLKSRIKEATSVDTGIVDALGKPVMRDIPADNTISFELASEIRSDLLGIGRSGQDLVASKGQAIGKRLAPALDKAMASAAKGAGPEVTAAWRKANAFWKNGKEIFNSRLLRELTKTDPKSVFDSMRGASPRIIRKIRTTIKDPEVWDEIKGQFMSDVLNKSMSQSDDLVGQVSGKRMLRELDKFGDDALKEIMSPTEIVDLRRMGRNLQIAQGTIGKDIPGGMAIQLAQAGLVGTFVLSGAGATPAIAIVVLPAAAAKLLTNKTFIKWMTIGNTVKPGTKQAINATGQVLALLMAEGGRVVSQPPGRPRKRIPNFRSATFGGPGRATR